MYSGQRRDLVAYWFFSFPENKVGMIVGTNKAQELDRYHSMTITHYTMIVIC